MDYFLSKAYNKLSLEERRAIERMYEENFKVILKEIFEALSNNRLNPSSIPDDPNSDFNVFVQNLYKEYMDRRPYKAHVKVKVADLREMLKGVTITIE